jgi:hypothetical protein
MDPLSRRVQLLAKLQARTRRLISSVHRNDDADELASELQGLLENRPLDLESLAAIGWHHWLLHSTGRAGDGSRVHRAKAFGALMPVFLLADDQSLLPEAALGPLAEAVDDPLAWIQRLGVDVGGLDEAQLADLWSRFTRATPVISANLLPRLGRLYEAVERHHASSGRVDVLEILLEDLTRLIELIPRQHHNHVPVLGIAATVAVRVSTLTGQAEELDSAIRWSGEALDLLDASDPQRPSQMWMRAVAFATRSQGEADSDDAGTALELLRELEADPAFQKPSEFDRVWSLVSGMEAIRNNDPDAVLTALASIGAFDASQVAALRTMLAELAVLQDTTVDTPETLARMERVCRDVLVQLPPGHVLWFELVGSLAWALMSQLHDNNDPRLDEAVGLLEEAMKTAGPAESKLSLAHLLVVVLQQRFFARDDPADMSRAAALAQEFGPGAASLTALFHARLTPPPDPTTPQGLIRPRTAFGPGPRVPMDMEALSAVLAFVNPHPDISTLATEISPNASAALGMLLEAIQRASEPAQLEDVHTQLEALMASLPEDSHERPTVLAILMWIRALRSVYAQDAESLAAFVSDTRVMLEAGDLPENLRPRMEMLIADANAARALLESNTSSDSRPSLGTSTDVADSRQRLLDISRDDSLSPSRRIHAAQAAADLARNTGQIKAAAEPLAVAVGLLPQVAPWHVRPAARRRHFERFTGMTSDAVALALANDSSEEADHTALQLLEVGRGVLHQQIIQSRSDLGDLRLAAPELAQRYEGLITRLSEDDANPSFESKPAWRHQAAEELKQVIAAIHREVPALHWFGGAPPIPELLAQSEQGPIAAVNLSDHGSCALLVRPDGVERVVLPQASLYQATLHVNNFVQAINALCGATPPSLSDSDRLRGVIHEVLTWAHHAITGPVLDRLELRPRDPNDCPRLWWVTGGLLSLLPLHAAGDYRAATPVLTADRAVSSYVPTIRQLKYARERTAAAVPDRPRGFAVGMSATPGHVSLDHAADEVLHVRGLLPDMFSIDDILLNDAARFDTVTERLRASTIAHFACHAQSDPGDPTASRITLSDHTTRPLTVAELSQLTIAHGQLAYLSACRTAQNTNGVLLDEALHLAGAFQVAGFPHVIGTLWPVEDDLAAEFARRFYATPVAGVEGFNPAVSARAKHLAMHQLRSQTSLTAPHLWAAWVHYGA